MVFISDLFGLLYSTELGRHSTKYTRLFSIVSQMELVPFFALTDRLICTLEPKMLFLASSRSIALPRTMFIQPHDNLFEISGARNDDDVRDSLVYNKSATAGLEQTETISSCGQTC